MTVRVLLCEDHAMVREGLARLLGSAPGIEVVGTAADGEEGVALAERLRPDVVMMDLSMPGAGGIEATRRLRALVPSARVVALTSSGDRDDVLEALDAGAMGFMLKTADGDELVRAIESASRGEAPLDPRAARAMLDRSRQPDPREGMTPREREILDLVGQGLPSKVIASRLGVSEATVKAHLTRVYRHIGVADRTQAALWAREHPERAGRRSADPFG